MLRRVGAGERQKTDQVLLSFPPTGRAKIKFLLLNFFSFNRQRQ
jgi:hypothetical protein